MNDRLRIAILAVSLVAARGAFADEAVEADAVKAVVTSAYVEGVHRQGDPALMRAGFHPEFRVFTDFLSLYKLPEGWRIVAKTFQSH